jgi:flagellar hook-associated protein 1
MGLSAALSISTNGLANVTGQLSLVSHNVANADTPGYVTEVGTQQSLNAGGVGYGVVSGPVTRNLDTALQAQAFQQNSTVAGLLTTQTALQAIDQVQGVPGQGGDIASQLGALQDSFSTLLNSPGDQTQQDAVVSSAATLATTINGLSNAYTTQRQTAQNAIVSEVGTINATLGTIGQLSNQIVSLRSSGKSTADLENQRDQAVQQLGQLVTVSTLVQPSGDMLITTAGGAALPIRGAADPLSTSSANVLPGAYYPGGGIPAITLNGTDVTAQLTGGQLGANITLRDTTLPTYQAELDEFSQNLASRFSTQGLTLFADPTGAVPAPSLPPAAVQSTYVGFAATIGVNPAVQSNPSLVRDGTGPSTPPAGTFTPNPAGGPAGFSTLIDNVLSYTLGANAAGGVPPVPQPTSNTTGLGASGTLSAPYAAPATLGEEASTLVAAQAQDSANTTSQLATEQAVQTSLNGTLNTGSGVNMDTEMSLMIQLQNAYGANAKVMSAVQSMWTQLLGMVQ